eukprot:1161745-Pelagomonas_calceolata.AAC.7
MAGIQGRSLGTWLGSPGEESPAASIPDAKGGSVGRPGPCPRCHQWDKVETLSKCADSGLSKVKLWSICANVVCALCGVPVLALWGSFTTTAQ